MRKDDGGRATDESGNKEEADAASMPKRKLRQGWEESFRRMAERGDDRLIEMPATVFDENEWEW